MVRFDAYIITDEQCGNISEPLFLAGRGLTNKTA
jgi:hypothetical protein